MKKLIGIVVGVVVLGTLVLGILRSQETEEVLSIHDIQNQNGVPIFAEAVSRHNVYITRTFHGTIESAEKSVVSAKLMERIAKIHAVEGDWVDKGDLLVSFDTTASMAAISQARLQYLNMKQDLDRMTSLMDQGAVSRQQFDQVKLGFDIAAENYLTAQRSVNLFAPISGTVSAIYFMEGDLAFPGDNVISIMDQSALEIVFSVTQEDRSLLRAGQAVQVTAGPGQIVEGSISRIDLAASSETRLFNAHAVIPSVDGVFPGVLASIEVIVREADQALAIPADAILERDGQTVVLVITDGSKVSVQPVQIGITGEDLVEVLHGLKEGDLVATYGHNSLEDGQLVKLIDDPDNDNSL